MTDQEIAALLLDECDENGNRYVQTDLFKLTATVHEWAYLINGAIVPYGRRAGQHELIVRRATIAAETGTYRHVAQFKGGTKHEDFIECVIKIIDAIRGRECLVALQNLEET